MCGILGFFGTDGSEASFAKAVQSLQHRGPDASGTYKDDNARLTLGHTRLSILDLSDAANQPFYSKDGRYVMVYNGEVYNYREIAKDCQIDPQTSSDTEIILQAYVQDGIQCFHRFNGMFALAIWDKQEQQLILARDRVGIKPLYYHYSKGNLSFASELKAIQEMTDLSVNPACFGQFLRLGYIPAPETAYKNTFKLEPGCYLKISADTLDKHSWWQAEMGEFSGSTNESELKDELHDLLLSSVKYRMISDVPLGTFLSGGIDSSMVTALAQKVSSNPVQTFSIGFTEAKHNESQHAAAVAKHLGTDHHEYMLSESLAKEQLAKLVDIYDEPFADSSAIPTMLVSEMTRKKVTVALSGDGGDELFQGYGMYDWARRLNNPFIQAANPFIKKALHASGNDRYKRASHLFSRHGKKSLKSHIFSQEQYYFSEEELEEHLIDDAPSSWHLEKEGRFDSVLKSPEERQAAFDFTYYLPDDLLVKVDRASMHHSLEVRVPLLDHRVVNFAHSLPLHLKKRKGVSKYLLKQILFDYVPKTLFDRPKWGFSIPLQKWLSGDLHYLMEDLLSDEKVREYGVMKPEYVKKLKMRFLQGEEYLYNRLWVLICLHAWMAKNL